MRFDPLGRRVAKTLLSTTRTFVYGGSNPVQELNGSTATANLLTGGLGERFQRTDATGTYSYLTDALGSTMALTDSTGAQQATYSYGPYGAMSISGSTTNSYGYTGRESDGLGIDYYRARYYNPQTGRFISEDPMGFRAGPNFYAYAGDDPIDFIDPFGMDRGPNGCGGNDGTPCNDPWLPWENQLPWDQQGPNTAPNNPQPQCTALQQQAAQIANLLDNASTESGLIATGALAGTALFGVGEGISLGGDTPITLTFGSMSAFFGTTSFMTGTAAAAMNSFAAGNMSALQNFDWSNYVNLATAAGASRIPGVGRWAETVGNLAEQGFDLSNQAEGACQ